MKADLDDAPEWVSSRRKRSRAGILIPGLIGTCITFGALYFSSQAFLQGTVQQIVEKRQQPQRVPVAEITRSEPSGNKDWDKVVDEVSRQSRGYEQPWAAEPLTQSAKQTVFNDLNYTPQGAVNIIPATSTYPEESPEPKVTRQKEIVVVGKESRLRDYCPYSEGSIERRNCRMSIDLNGGR